MKSDGEPEFYLVRTMSKIQRQVYYSGRVQGVGFRYTVRQIASGYEVTGWVRNLFDGRVELLARGEPPEVKAFLAAIMDSELGAYVRNVETHDLAAPAETDVSAGERGGKSASGGFFIRH